MDLGLGEIVVILAIVLLLFGPSKLPQLGESLAKGIRGFKQGLEGDDASKRAADSGAGAAAPAASPAPAAQLAASPERPADRAGTNGAPEGSVPRREGEPS